MAMIGQTRFVERGKVELLNTMVVAITKGKAKVRVAGFVGVDPIDIESESQDVIDNLRRLSDAMRETALSDKPSPELPRSRGKRTANGLTLPNGMVACPRCHGCFNARTTCERCDGEGFVRG